MDIKFIEMAYELSKYKKVVLYGIGNMAQIVYEGLCKYNIEIDYCVVSKKQNSYFMDSVPVFEVQERIAELKDKNTVILISVSKLYENEIEDILKKNKIKEYLRFTDFVYESLLEEYRSKDIEQCKKEITIWKLISSKRKWEEFEIVKEEINQEINNGEQNSNKIIFAVGDLSPRVLKILKALKNEKIVIKILFYPDAYIRPFCWEELQKIEIQYTQCKDIEELLYEIIKEHVKTVHIFSQGRNTIIPYILIKMRSILPNLVYDEYDIINEFYCDYPEECLEEERFCLENADGVCNRAYELDYLAEKFGYSYKGKTIQFFDYCRDDEIIKRTDCLNDELSICYAGGVLAEKDYPNSIFSCWLELAKMCEKAQCHLHVYPAIWSEENYAEYIETDKTNMYFHFHQPVPSDSLRQELSQYDYGIHPIHAGFLDQDTAAYYKRDKMIYAVTNHFYDYLDAGLPIIAAWPILFAKSFEKKGILLPWTVEEYNFDFLRKNKSDFKNRVETVRKELRMKNHIYKLLEFYNSLQAV